MLNDSANCNEILYDSVKCRYHLPHWDSKSVHYVRKFIVSDFVINVKFCEDLLRFLPGTQKQNLTLSDNLLYPFS